MASVSNPRIPSTGENHANADPMKLNKLWFRSIKRAKLLEIYRLIFTHPQVIGERLSNNLAYPANTVNEAQHYLGPATSNMDSLQVAMICLYSAKERHVEEEIHLRKAVVDVILNASNDTSLATSIWGAGNTTLHLASFMDDEKLVNILIDKGCKPDVINHRGHTCRDVTTSSNILNRFKQETTISAMTKRYSLIHCLDDDEMAPEVFIRKDIEQDNNNEFPEIPSLNWLLTQREISPPRILISNTAPSTRQASVLREDITGTLITATTERSPQNVFSHLKKLPPSREPLRADKIFPNFHSIIKKKGSMDTVRSEENTHTKSGTRLKSLSRIWKRVALPNSKSLKHSVGSEMDIEIENFNVVYKPKTKWSWSNSLSKLKSLKA
ncbi:hypothetical protein K7432_007625 [Basidiobolus ranarum]|uniref:Uncharacterized protein n=1 Tax=Basidiobolus ranarum TaxID=34480 RepID=A0ABR2WT24_9FUNG